MIGLTDARDAQQLNAARGQETTMMANASRGGKGAGTDRLAAGDDMSAQVQRGSRTTTDADQGAFMILLAERDAALAQVRALSERAASAHPRIVELEERCEDLELALQVSASRHRRELMALGFVNGDGEGHMVVRPHAPAEAARRGTQASVSLEVVPVVSTTALPQPDRVGRFDKQQFQALKDQAGAAAKAQDWNRAVELYAKVVAYKPNAARVWVQFGHAAKEAGDEGLAERAYFRALALDPSDPDLAQHLGHLLRKRGEPERALEIFVGALASTPDNATLRNKLDEMGEDTSSLPRAPYPRAQPLRGAAHWLYQRGLKAAQAAAIQKRWADAARRYEKLLAGQPGNVRLRLQLAHSLKEQGKLEAAEATYRACVATQPLNSEAWLQLGHVLKIRGEFDDAADAYRRALRLDPESASARTEVQNAINAQ